MTDNIIAFKPRPYRTPQSTIDAFWHLVQLNDPARLKANQPIACDQLYAQLAWVESMLVDGRSFLLGAAPTLADFAVYNPVWFVRERIGPAAAPLDRMKLIARWAERMGVLGTGNVREMTPAEALDVARTAEPQTPAGVDKTDPSGNSGGRIACGTIES